MWSGEWGGGWIFSCVISSYSIMVYLRTQLITEHFFSPLSMVQSHGGTKEVEGDFGFLSKEVWVKK